MNFLLLLTIPDQALGSNKHLVTFSLVSERLSMHDRPHFIAMSSSLVNDFHCLYLSWTSSPQIQRVSFKLFVFSSSFEDDKALLSIEHCTFLEEEGSCRSAVTCSYKFFSHLTPFNNISASNASCA
ncbi:MAG: hypothetical protein EXX96DRAFT_587059 [Benjaminiella poitrasii]|nr:MAG: hypothetical protein EXX96DRAFT_587059 [Benjaminiella poitrasii]